MDSDTPSGGGLPVLNVILGTAGHIDHGKTALIKRITGIDADRFEEEHRRGMTIDIGYAHMAVDRKRNLGIIDVPGHERFVKNMVSGATGVGMVILTVAADDGVMPQTREHIEILQLLGVKRGAVALTKIDLVDEELADLVEEDIRGFVRSTFLEGAPILRVSSVTGEGFEALERVISELVEEAEPPSDAGPLYLPVQRSFVSEGHGTVITGVPTRGKVRVGDALEIVPSGKEARVRRIEAYGNRIEEARAGHRTALNLTEAGHREIRRGDVIATPGYFRAHDRILARLHLLPSRKRPLKHLESIRFHVGCAEATGRAFLLETGDLSPGGEARVHIRLDAPVVAAPGDRYILRAISPPVTIGGGVVIGGEPRRLKRGRPWVIEEVRRRERMTGAPAERMREALREAGAEPTARKEAARRALLLEDQAGEVLEGLVEAGEARRVGSGNRFVLASAFEEMAVAVEGILASYHEKEPLSEGMDRGALRNAAGAGKEAFEAVLAHLEGAGRVGRRFGLFHRAGFSVALSEEEAALKDRIEKAFLEGSVSPPSPEAVLAAAGDGRAPALYRLLLQRGVLVEIVRKDLSFHRDVLEAIRGKIVEEVEREGGLVPASFRDRLGTTRKYIIPLLEHFDKIGLTVRVENRRFLREHARDPEGEAGG